MKPNPCIHTHWQVIQGIHTIQNLPKSMAASTIKQKKFNKHGHTTIAIRNAGRVLNMKLIAKNKISGKLEINHFKIPHYA